VMALLSPKAWLAIGLALVLALSHAFAYRAGRASIRAAWDRSIIAQQQTSATAEAENRRLETLRQSRVIEAQNAQVNRTRVLQAAAAGARAESDGLRGDLARDTADLSRTTIDACRKYAATASAVLGDMAAEGGDMAEKAGGHAADSLTFEQGWPR